MNLPTKLASLRKKKGMTQLELAEKLDISRQAVSRWEAGSVVPSTDNLKTLSDLYGVSVDYLLNEDADDSCGDAENQRQKPKEQGGEAKGAKHKRIFIFVCALILVVAIVIVICVMAVQSQKQKQEQIVPIGEMDTIVGDDYPVETFCIGW